MICQTIKYKYHLQHVHKYNVQENKKISKGDYKNGAGIYIKIKAKSEWLLGEMW